MFQYIADIISFGLFKLNPASTLGQSVNFFIYDSLKITFSIIIIITIISFLRTYLSSQNIKQILSKEKFGLSYLIASLFGAISPFCSCSSVPIFIGFAKAGVPIGVAFAFLITSPLVNEIVFVLMIGTFGLKTALLYSSFGILLGIVGGMILQRTGLDKDIIGVDKKAEEEYLPKTLSGKLEYAISETASILKRIFPYILIGIAIGAFIHGYVPTDFITTHIKSKSLFAVPIAVLIGVPLYAGCSTLVPIIFAFTQKGIATGTALALMMAVAGLSFPEAVMLKSVMKTRLFLIFFSIVTIGIICIGYFFNLIY